MICVLQIYIWVGHNSRENEKTEAIALAHKYLGELNKQNGRDIETPITLVQSGKEPPTFTCHFLGWDDTRGPAFEDPYTAKLKALQSEQEEDSELAKLAAERRQKFVDPLEAKKATPPPKEPEPVASPPPKEPATPPVTKESTPVVVTEESTPAEEIEEFRFKPLVHFFPLEELKVRQIRHLA